MFCSSTIPRSLATSALSPLLSCESHTHTVTGTSDGAWAGTETLPDLVRLNQMGQADTARLLSSPSPPMLSCESQTHSHRNIDGAWADNKTLPDLVRLNQIGQADTADPERPLLPVLSCGCEHQECNRIGKQV